MSASELGDSSNAGNITACQIAVEILQHRAEVIQSFALGYVIRKVLKIPEPMVSVLPVEVTRGRHISV